MLFDGVDVPGWHPVDHFFGEVLDRRANLSLDCHVQDLVGARRSVDVAHLLLCLRRPLSHLGDGEFREIRQQGWLDRCFDLR